MHRMNAYWRAANYRSIGQIYLYDNPLLKRSLEMSDVKRGQDLPEIRDWTRTA